MGGFHKNDPNAPFDMGALQYRSPCDARASDQALVLAISKRTTRSCNGKSTVSYPLASEDWTALSPPSPNGIRWFP